MDPTSPPSPDPQPPSDDQPGAETVDPIEGLAVGADYYAEHAQPAVAVEGYDRGEDELRQPPAPPSVWSTQTSDLAQGVSLRVALLGLQEAVAAVKDEDDLVTWGGQPSDQGQALLEAGRTMLQVFHQRPVEGWHWSEHGQWPPAAFVHAATATAADDAVALSERLMEAERLAYDVRQETGGSPEWTAVVAELLDHLAPLRGSRNVDTAVGVSARGSAAPAIATADGSASAAARPPTDRPVADGAAAPHVDPRNVLATEEKPCTKGDTHAPHAWDQPEDQTRVWWCPGAPDREETDQPAASDALDDRGW